MCGASVRSNTARASGRFTGGFVASMPHFPVTVSRGPPAAGRAVGSIGWPFASGTTNRSRSGSTRVEIDQTRSSDEPISTSASIAIASLAFGGRGAHRAYNDHHHHYDQYDSRA